MSRKLRFAAPLAVIAALVIANVPAVHAAPSVTVTAPTANAKVQGLVTLKATASTGTLGVQFKVNGQNVGAEDTIAPYQTTWDTNGLVNAPHQITAVARRLTYNLTSSAVTVQTYNLPFAGTVEVVGDSVSQQAFDPNADNVQTFTTNAPASNLRDIYVRMGWAVPNVQQHVTDMAIFRWPERLVVALGANDANPTFGGDGWTNTDLQNFRTLINTVHTNSCVVLVLPFAGTGANSAWATEINEARTALTSLATERPRTLVADWATVVAQHPEYMDEDGIHLLTPYTNPTEDLIAASEGRLNPVDPAAADARQEFYWSSAAQCSQFN